MERDGHPVPMCCLRQLLQGSHISASPKGSNRERGGKRMQGMNGGENVINYHIHLLRKCFGVVRE